MLSKLLPLTSSFFLFLWVFLIPNPVNGQDIPEAPLIRAHVDVVNILATVKNRRGHYVKDLNMYDFEIFEDKVRQRLEFFNYETGQGGISLTIVVLIDTSGSVKQELAFEQRAAIEFLRSTLREKKDLAAVVQFDSDVNLVQDFTFDLKQLESSIHSMIPPGGATKLYDAIVIATEDMLRHEVGRKVIVVLSDGADTQSFYNSKDAIKSAQDRDIIIFGIGVRNRASYSDFGQLREFAEATGGAFFKSQASLSRLREAFAKINEEITNQVSLGYVSTNIERNGTFRSIRVKVKRRGIKIRHRKGYYAPGKGSPAKK